MIAAQCDESSRRSRTSARNLPPENEQDALNETTIMSTHGPHRIYPIILSSDEASSGRRDGSPWKTSKDSQTQTSDSYVPSGPLPSLSNSRLVTNGENQVGLGHKRRIHFADFSDQLRQQQYFESRKTLLKQRKRVLQKTITLSARLHRISSWVGDGLAEISAQSDAVGFGRVHQHFQNLMDLSYSQWDHELHMLDPLGRLVNTQSEAAGSSDLTAKLSNSAQSDLLDLLAHLRSNPRFLVERFKVLAPAQVSSLWNPPRFRNTADSQFEMFGQNRQRLLQQRTQSFSKSLEDYTSSFERSNPLSFLLFNIYGTNQSSTDAENELRLATWSTVCAELIQTSENAYPITIQLLDRFASLYDWRARDSVEMFLMDVLQKGSFLLDQSPDSIGTRRHPGSDHFQTPDARNFFDTAVRELFAIFVKYDGGFPTGALQFASAILYKLPRLEQQSEFRGIFLCHWFVERFLQSLLNYPETEDMLLKFHINKNARLKILRQLYISVHDRVYDVFSQRPTYPIDPIFKYNVEVMVGKLVLIESVNPYTEAVSTNLGTEDGVEASITISLTEVVQMLEALSPQAISGVGSIDQLLETTVAFSASRGQHAHASARFDRLRGLLISLLEPGSSTIDTHPCQEQWVQVDIDRAGIPQAPQILETDGDSLQNLQDDHLDDAQRGALRLFVDRASDTVLLSNHSYQSDVSKIPSLAVLFREMAFSASARLDPIGHRYWNRAIDTLHEKYPLSKLVNDDSPVLSDLLHVSLAAQAQYSECCRKLENQLSTIEAICHNVRTMINKSLERFDSLRLKIWYSIDVVPSRPYGDAKNVARALMNMATLAARNMKTASTLSFVSGRPGSSRSVASSTFEQPFQDTMNIMKASTAEGGPKKLSDKQIELTRSWLEQTHTENFCVGEERIHRFCMEIDSVSKILVGETLSESPVLWASDLFARERSLYDTRPFSVTSAPASTRPASVMSDSMSAPYRPSRPFQRGSDSLRMTLPDDRRSNASSRIYRDLLPPELASSISSLSRTQSATTAESISSVFSPLPSNTRSMTSPSVYSRPASIFNDLGLCHFTDTSHQKAKFLEKVHRVLICLLLSDLGGPLWSLGSETDSMLVTNREIITIDRRLKQRMVAEALADGSSIRHGHQAGLNGRSRSKSISAQLTGQRLFPTPDSSGSDQNDDNDSRHHSQRSTAEYLADLTQLLRKLSRQVDPMDKLSVIEEFYQLSLTTLNPPHHTFDHPEHDRDSPHSRLRRTSLDGQTGLSGLSPRQESRRLASLDATMVPSHTVHDITQHLKMDLAKLRPQTLFRDLQYISAFVPEVSTDDTPRGKALMQVGLAALAYKDDVCRSMVDVADKMISQTKNPYSQPQTMQTIAQLWMSAARERNAVAQRELALLYLSRPQILPVMSLPLWMPSQVFRTDISRYKSHDNHSNTQALCLALHWLQQASDNGDKLARSKLEERKAGISIR